MRTRRNLATRTIAKCALSLVLVQLVESWSRGVATAEREGGCQRG